ENGKLQLAAAENFKGVSAAGFFHAQGDVGEQLFVEALAEIAGGDIVAFASAEGRSVDGEEHGNGRLIDDDRRQRRGILGAGNRLSDGDAFDASDGNDVGALEAAEAEELGDFCLVEGAVALGDSDVFSSFHGAGKNAGDGEASEVVAVIEICDEDLQRSVFVTLGSGNGVDDGVKQRTQVLAGRSLMLGCGACLGIGIED